MKAAIFDMDGLMLDTEPMYKRAWQSAAKDLGFEIEDSFYLRLIGLTTLECEAKLLRHLGSNFPLAEFRRLWESKWNSEAQQFGINRKTGIIELLCWLESCKIPVAVATSSDIDYASFCLNKSELSKMFEHIVSGDLILNSKPAPDIYFEAAKRLNTKPEDCIAFEDSEAGVLSAHSAGMKVYMVPDLKQPSLDIRSIAYNVSDSLLSVLNHLKVEHLSSA